MDNFAAPTRNDFSNLRYFNLVKNNIDVAPLLREIELHENAWLVNTRRQEKISVQRHTNSIFIRNATHRPDIPINENQESGPTKLAVQFPKALAFMLQFAAETNGSLSRATIVRLKPHSQVYSHVDNGSYYLIRDRYHLVLYSTAGSVMCSGDETVRMRPGELWWFDNKQYHASLNDSAEWRTHLIFDVLPRERERMARNPNLPMPTPYLKSD